MPNSPAISIENLTHEYGDHRALDGVSLSIERGEIFGLLGPNGSGKTTLFRILSTLIRPGGGTARIFGHDVQREADAARRHMGVVFQRPSVDGKLTVAENLHHHGRLYGISRASLPERSRAMMQRLGLVERAGDRVDTLSGGLQRRVELAKALLHRPELLVLDEPSSGLDPAARREFLRYLDELRTQDGVTVVLTTHYLEEAERCDRVGILHRGRLIGLGKPDDLKAEVGGDVVVIHAQDAADLQRRIRSRFDCEVTLVDGTLRTERPRGHEFLRELVDAFPTEVKSVTFGKPTLEDVFVHLTGDRFWESPTAEGEAA